MERVAIKIRRKRKEKVKFDEVEFRQLVAEAEERQKKAGNIIFFPSSHSLPAEPVERYAALLDIWEHTGKVPESEIPFMREFEARLTESERKYWDFMREYKGLPPIGEFGEAKKEAAG